MGGDASTKQIWAPRSGAQSCPVRALSPIVWCPLGGGPERAPTGLRGGGLASRRGVSAVGRRPASRLTRI
eukprot:4843810-Alexandrium_andersonii.AAC.1